MKINVNSRNNHNTTLGIVDLIDSKLDQAVLSGSDVTFNSVTTTNDLTVGGNLLVNGSTIISHSDIVNFKDNIILVNADETTSGVSLNLSGIEIERGTSTNFQAVFQESTDLYKIGFTGNLQAVATREDTPLNNGVMVYNPSFQRLDSVSAIQIPITFSAGINSASSTSGTVIINGGGGLGITGDTYLDNRLFLKGSDYSNFIRADGSNQVIINSGSNTVFQQPSGSTVKIPTNVNLTLSSINQNLSSDGTNITVICATGDILLTTALNGNITLPVNTYLKWNNSNRIRFDGSNLNLEASGSFGINSIINSTNSTASTSSSIGSVKIFGGISISNTTNAVSSSNGGTITSAGGGSFAKDFYIGQNLYVIGQSILQQTSINTDNGNFNVSGSNPVNIIVSNTGLFRTTSGSLTLEATSGSLILNGSSGVSSTSSSGISLNAGASSNFTTSSGLLTISGAGLSLLGNSGNTTVSTSQSLILSSGSGGTTLNTTDLVNGIKIGNSTNAPILLGNGSNEITLNGDAIILGDLTVSGITTSIETQTLTVKDNMIIVNSAPSGISDGGYSIRRYQTPNDTNLGSVVSGSFKETGSFQTGSSAPDTLVLDVSSNSTDDYYRGWWIKITSGSGINQVRRIKTYNGTTKTAIIYITADNTSTFTDGLDLTTAPSSGDTFNLYDNPFYSVYFKESSNEFRFSAIPYDTSQGTIQVPTTYASIHAQDLILEGGISILGDSQFGKLTVDTTDPNAFLVRKVGNTGDVFNVDTTNGIISIINPVNTVSSEIPVLFKQKDNLNNYQNYSKITSEILDNTSGSIQSNLDFLTSKGVSGLVSFIKLRGDLGFVDIGTNVSSFRILNTTASTSSNSGSLRVDGGIGVSNTTDASSLGNGGSFTSAGGGSFDKKLFIGGGLYSNSTNQLNNSTNTIVGNEGNINSQGDVILYNPTKNTIVFRQTTGALPSFTTRSSGNKIVLYPNISGSTVDNSLGIDSSLNTWYSVGDNTKSHKFYLGIDNVLTIDDTGILFNPTTSSSVLRFNTTLGSDTNVLILNGGGNIGNTRGSQLELYGEDNTGEAILSSSLSGQIKLRTGNSIVRLNILSTGQTVFSSTEETTNSSTGAVRISSGGLYVNKSIILGSSSNSILGLDFNQRYDFSGNVLGHLNIQSKTSGIIHRQRNFSFDGDNSVDNLLEIYGLGTPSADTNTEFLQVGYSSSSTSYNIRTLNTGTGSIRTLSIQTGSNTDQIKLLTSGSVSLSSTTASTSSTSGALNLVGGLSINNTTDASSHTNGGTITSAGGMAIAKTGYIGGRLRVNTNSLYNNTQILMFPTATDGESSIGFLRDTTEVNEVWAVGHKTGLASAGTFGIYNSVFAGNVLTISNTGQVRGLATTNSTSSTTGACVFDGGVAISNTTNSTSSSNGGAFTVGGGGAFGGDLYTGGAVFTSSDKRIKENIETLNTGNYLDLITKLNCVSYNKINNPTKKEIGLIAQELQEIYPELVSGSEEDYYSVDYQKLCIILIMGMKELISKI